MKNILCLVYILSLFACDTKECYVNDVYVNKLITLTNEDYSELQASGGAVFIEGGNAGIIVYHLTNDEYKAYDRNCTYNSCDECAYIDSINSGIAYCGCCTSAFLLDQDGEAVNSPAFMPLKQYYCILNGQILRIYN